MRRPLRVYRLLLKLYPAAFREQYQAPLERQFKDDFAEVHSTGAAARFWLATLADFARSMPQQLAREVGQDARQALRLWRRRPLAAAFSVAVLTIAIGANTGVFSVVNALLLRSLPFHDPARLAVLDGFGPPREGFHEWHRQSAYLADAATYDTLEVNVEGVHHAARLTLAETSWNFFSLLGARPAAGRTFAGGEDTAGRNAVAVIGHGLWQRLYGGAPGAVGSTIRINGAALTIVGVAPPGFDFPQKAEVWTPTTFDYQRIPKTGSVIFWTTIGRLKPPLTWAQAQQAFQAEAQTRNPRAHHDDPRDPPRLTPLQEQIAGPVGKASLILMAGVGLLLLLACANVANLLLARTVARSSELAIRTALGASRARLTQQLLTETLLMSLVATAAGLVVARWTAQLVALGQPAALGAQAYQVLEWRVLAFAAVLSIATGLVFGVGPALYAGRGALTAHHRTATASVRHARTRSLLIAAQIAVTVVLLTGSIALGRAFTAMLHVERGYQIESMVTMTVSLAGTPHQGRAAWPYLDDILGRIRQIPGVVSASGTESLPLNVDSFAASTFTVDNQGSGAMATVVNVAPGFFATIGGRVIAGREFTETDLSTTEPLAVVNDHFARGFGDPAAIVGRRLTAARGGTSPRIVGVVRGLRFGPGGDPHPQVFRPSRNPRALTIVARVRGAAGDRVAAVRDAAQSVDPKIPVFNVKTMEERLEIALAQPKFYTLTVFFFGGLGLLLAVIGIYGVVSYAVLQRTREMGIRLALGTTPSRLRRAMLRQTLIVVAAGAAAGIAGAVAFGQFLQTLVRGAEGATLSGSTLAVAVTALVSAAAIWRATRHVSRLDISDVLRAEAAE
jgi:putative ABC transport system permease protein